MNTMPYFLTSKYQEILEKSAIERKLKDSGMDFEQGPLEITPGQPIGQKRQAPGAGGPYTSEYLKSKFEE